MFEFTIGDYVLYTPPFGSSKPVIVKSSPDGSGYVDIQFVDYGDFAEFRDMGISEVVNEMDRIGRVPNESLSPVVPSYYEETDTAAAANTPPLPNRMNIPHDEFGNGVGGRRRRPSSRSRRRGAPRRRLSRRH